MIQQLKKMILVMGLCCGVNVHAENIDRTVQDILNDVNHYRTQHGLNPLKLKQDMSVEAYKHSLDMAKHRMPFGHNGFNDRVKHMYAHVEHPNGAAENVAYRYRDGHDVVKNWLTSPHHLANIRGHYDYTGIGLARDSAGHLYFTQLFLKVG
ncbi:MAG: CAP domain-containing protein [Gammaproteobacteria bacterium]|nr:CAP domain-containing protein [Gammaproteobacteria bacterium]